MCAEGVGKTGRERKGKRIAAVNYVSINVMKRNLNATQVALALTMGSGSARLHVPMPLSLWEN